jgi:glyoxylase-like metal-dependent hydrolase (beta-lactamase superfamily II)
MREALTRLGGVQHQLMCHWHEAKHCDAGFYQDHAPVVYAPEAEREIVHKLVGEGVKVNAVRDRRPVLRDFMPYEVSGHSVGSMVYVWRDFLFGGDFIWRRDDGSWVSIFQGNCVEAGLKGYATLRALQATQWLPAKSTGAALVPFAFDSSKVDEAERKMRKKWGLPGSEGAVALPARAAAAPGRARAR